MRKTHWLAVPVAALLVAACGSDPTPANAPDQATSAAPAPSDVAPAMSAPVADTPPAASAPPVATTPPAPPPATPIAVSPLKIAGNKETAGKAVEVKADGTVMVGNKPMAKFAGAELQDKDGKTILAVAGDGTVTGPSVNRAVKLSTAGELVSDDGSKFTVGDDGSVTETTAAGKTNKAPFKVTGVTAESRREAALLVGMLMLISPPPTPTASAPAKSTPAAMTPKPKK